MNQREAGRLGGKATLAKHGAHHFSVIGAQGGRPPLTILPPKGTPREIIKLKGGEQWRIHNQLMHICECPTVSLKLLCNVTSPSAGVKLWI